MSVFNIMHSTDSSTDKHILHTYTWRSLHCMLHKCRKPKIVTVKVSSKTKNKNSNKEEEHGRRQSILGASISRNTHSHPLQLGPSQALPCINTLEHNVIQFHSSLKASFSHCTKRTAFQVFPHPCAHNRRAFIVAKERAVSTSMRKICTISCMLISTGVYATKRGHLKFLHLILHLYCRRDGSGSSNSSPHLQLKCFGHVAHYAESEDMLEFLGTAIERHNSVNMTTFDQPDLKMMPLFWMTYI